MNSTEKQIDEALKKLAQDPVLAAQFDEMRSRDYPNASRRKACELGLKAITARNESALATQRAKAMKHLATAAVSTFKKVVATITPRIDKRQGDLPLAQWSFGHLASAAQAGDQLAVAEIKRRGFEINGTTFTKKA
jgi:hypothetical protein